MYAALQATLHNAHFRSKEHHPQPFKAADFLPGQSGAAPQRQSWQEQMAVMRGYLRTVGEMNRDPEALRRRLTEEANERSREEWEATHGGF